jgi:peptidoglycan hydrolase-like protein with peptidoglycan-binding domain
LTYFGYKPGVVDGWFGQNTQNALLKFQNKQGLAASGQLDDATFKALKDAAMG